MPATDQPVDRGAEAARRALAMIRDLQARLVLAEAAGRQPIAICGLACRLPGGVEDPEGFWDLLAAGRDAITEVPPSRWDIDAWYHPDPDRPGTMATRWGGFLDGVDLFDAQHFAISRREAEALDPQHRLWLEGAWHALEDADVAPDGLVGREVGIFLGLSTSDYGTLLGAGRGPEWIDAYASLGNAPSAAAGRLAFSLGTRGPALVVDTACSSSLVAVHLAVQSLRRGECELAIAGGVNLTLTPELTVNFTKAHMLAPDGRCKPFDARADGYVRAEGCGVVVLRRLADVAGGRVRAVIRGSAVNQDGRSAGLTAPSGPAQEAVVRAALADAGLAPGAVDAIEAHGTGTALGDPIELGALAAVFGARERPLWVGSVKGNLGHAEAAAGIAGLIKAVLMLERGAVAPSLHFERLNPHAELGGCPVQVPVRPGPAPKVVGVSSFGFSGTNAHVVLAAAPPVAAVAAGERPVVVLPLAGRTEAAFGELAAAYRARLAEGADWPGLARAGARRQARLAWRGAVVASGAAEAEAALAQLVPVRAAGRPKIGFLITGQGAGYPGMAQGLLAHAPVVAETFRRCEAVMGLDRPLAELMADGAALARTGTAQPVLFALAVGLGRQLHAWGIEPAALLGHSLGEYAAAVLAEAAPLEDVAALVARRAALMQALPAGGGMAAVLGPRAAALALLRRHEGLEVAAWNAPEALTVAGPLVALERLAADPAAAGLTVQPLPVSHAFHSALLEPMLDGLEAAAGRVAWAPPRLPVIGNRSGTAVARFDAAHWRLQARAPVRFEDGLRAMAGLGCEVLVELGPQPVLSGLARATLGATPPALPTLARGRDPFTTLAGTLAELFRQGAQPDWTAFDPTPTTTPAPTYPFQRQSYWVPEAPPAARRIAEASQLLEPRIDLAQGGSLWRGRLAPDRPAFLAEHKVQDEIVVPGASHVAMALAAAAALPAALVDVSFVAPMILTGGGRELQLLEQEGALSLFAGDGQAPWNLHMRAARADPDRASPLVDRQALIEGLVEDADGPAALYAMLTERSIALGPAFRRIVRLWRGEGEAVAELAPLDASAATLGLPIHPALLDACFQTLGATFAGAGASGAFLPFAIERIALDGIVAGPVWVHARARPAVGTADAAQGDLVMLDRAGRTLCRVEGLSVARVRTSAPGDNWLYRVAWEPAPLPAAALAPAMAALAEAVSATGAELSATLAASGDLGRELELVAASYAAQALADVRPAEVDPKRQRLFSHLPTMAGSATPRAGEILARIRQNFGDRPESRVAQRCGEALPAVLRGEADPLAILFDSDDAGALYGESEFARLLNRMVVSVLERMAAAAESARPLRVIEIGAGTGALCATMRERLAARRIDYTFTDISPAFLTRAAEQFDGHGLSFGLLDIERDPVAQGFAAGGFDVVLVGNVLHATRDLRASLRHAQRLLGSGGVLVFLEAVRRSAWSDLVFGLTDGWWRFADHDLRPDHPLLDIDSWRRLLAERFAEVAEVPSPGGGEQAVLIARRQAGAEAVIVRPSPQSTALDASHDVLSRLQAELARDQPAPVRIVLPGGLAIGEGTADPAMAAAGALARVAMLEHPELDCRLIDAQDVPQPEWLAGDEPEIAWRDGMRLARRLRPVRLPNATDFRTSGAHIVTGGLGGLGPGLAAWLKDRGAERVILLARRPEAAQALPPGVEAARGDVTSRADLAALFGWLKDEGATVRGIFHLAGSLDDGAAVRLDRGRLERVYRAKLEGVVLLDELSATLELDAFVMFGTTAAVWGNPGQANHAGANAGLGALAWQRRARGLSALVIHWGAWAGAGAIDREGVGGRFAAQGVQLMAPDHALALLDRALVAGETELVAAAIDWPRFLQKYGGTVPPFFTAQLPRTLPEMTRPPAAAAEPVVADRADLARCVTASAGAVLGLRAGEAVAADQPLNELGLDSLMALELRKRLGDALGLQLPATLLFSYPTIDALTAHLGDLLALPHDGEPAEVQDEVESMSEAEMTALIEAEFELAVAQTGR